MARQDKDNGREVRVWVRNEVADLLDSLHEDRRETKASIVSEGIRLVAAFGPGIERNTAEAAMLNANYAKLAGKVDGIMNFISALYAADADRIEETETRDEIEAPGLDDIPFDMSDFEFGEAK